MVKIPVYRIYAQETAFIDGIERPKITGPQDIADLFNEYVGTVPQENFVALMLNTKHYVTGIHTVAIGTLNSANVEPREVFTLAILTSATAIAVAHNHPSGDPTPSPEDHAITSKLVKAGVLLGIRVLDHVIVAGPRHFSFNASGHLAAA